jgi:hypothetical protein
VVVIDCKVFGLAGRVSGDLFALAADSADATLVAQHFLIPRSVYAVCLPFALFNVVLVAQIFSVQDVVAAIDLTLLRRFLAITISGVAVPQ